MQHLAQVPVIALLWVFFFFHTFIKTCKVLCLRERSNVEPNKSLIKFITIISLSFPWSLKLTSHGTLDYLWSVDLFQSFWELLPVDCVNIYFSQSIVNCFFNIFLKSLKVWHHPTLLTSWFINFKCCVTSCKCINLATLYKLFKSYLTNTPWTSAGVDITRWLTKW